MAIEMLYFAWVRERIGKGSERIDPPTSIATVDQLIDWLSGLGPEYADVFADKTRLRAAIDQQFVPIDTAIAGAREIAIFPPVTGG